jgi:short-chain fatty acids transporter
MGKGSSQKDEQAINKSGILERFGLWLAEWSEKWFPDALVFALLGVLIVFIIGILLGESPTKLAIQGGKSFWVLIPFTMQMAMIIIGGYVVASTPAVYFLIKRLASVPKTGKGATAFVAFFSMFTSLISWGFSLVFSGLLVRELTRRDISVWVRFGHSGFPHLLH